MGPDGSMLFLHRTSDAKLNPELEYPEAYEPVQFITPPLSPRQAAQVHISGTMQLEKFNPERSEICEPTLGYNLTGTARTCGLLDTVSSEIMPGDMSSFFPIPLFNLDEFPAIQVQLQSSMTVFRHLQQLYLARTLNLGTSGAFVQDLPQIAQSNR